MEILEGQDAWLAAYRAGWLANYETTGEFNWKIYQRPRNPIAPAGSAVKLSDSRLILITTAGGYLRKEQRPFDAEGPAPARLNAVSLAFFDQAISEHRVRHITGKIG